MNFYPIVPIKKIVVILRGKCPKNYQLFLKTIPILTGELKILKNPDRNIFYNYQMNRKITCLNYHSFELLLCHVKLGHRSSLEDLTGNMLF